jgi:hypothetical protein
MAKIFQLSNIGASLAAIACDIKKSSLRGKPLKQS